MISELLFGRSFTKVSVEQFYFSLLLKVGLLNKNQSHFNSSFS